MKNTESKDVVIKVDNIKKDFYLYKKPSDRVKEALSLTKKQYHDVFKALDGINFEVQRGETVGIIGSNGAGKSTLLKILTGVIKPTSGDFIVNGRISALLELGTGFNPEYTGIENIELNGKMMGFTKEEIESKKEGIIRFADIGEYIYQPVKNYSSGMFARLAFAVAISIEPEILIVDEALSVGDIFFQGKCFQKFDELKKKGTSILFVSHDISTVRRMCSNVLWIEKGKQIDFGDSAYVCECYINKLIQKNKENVCSEEIESNSVNICNTKSRVYEYPQIQHAENSILSEDVEIISTYVRDNNNSETRVLKTDSEYTVGVLILVKKNINSIIVGFNLNNNRGITVVCANTFLNKKETFNSQNGDIIEVEFNFKLPKIRSGAYEISPAVAIGTQDKHKILTMLHGAVGVDVDNANYELSEVGMDFKQRVSKICEYTLV